MFLFPLHFETVLSRECWVLVYFFHSASVFFPHKSGPNLDLVLEFLSPDLLYLRIGPVIQGKFSLFHSFNTQAAIFSF